MAKAQSSNDSVLIERVRNGDTNAFNVLVHKYHHQVMGVIARMVADWSECYDVAQDTFLSAYRGIHQFRNDAQFSTWLYRIAVNSAKNHIMKQKRHARPYQYNASSDQHIEEHALEVPDLGTPEGECSRQQLEAALLDAIDALPEELRTAIILREIDGVSYECIAEKMQCPIGTVRSRIFRARESIDEQLRFFVGHKP